jgi:diguanylate cyclase (GGDEF)-like protein
MQEGTSAQQLEALIQFLYQAPIGLVQTTLEGEILMINPLSAQLLMPLAYRGRLTNLFEVLGKAAPQLRALAAHAHDPGAVICDGLRLHAPSAHRGDATPSILALKLVRLDDVSLIGTISDATGLVQREQQKIAAQLHIAAHVDTLTRMPNGLALAQRIDLELGRMQDSAATRFALLLVNADRFDRINVALGRTMGDAVLQSMAARLQSMNWAPPWARDGEAGFIARLGADEFAVLLPLPAQQAEATEVASACVEALRKPYLISDIALDLSASVGSVIPSFAARSAEAVLQEAVLALREAKRAGGARHCAFVPALLDEAVRRASLETELRTALGQNQLFVVYQPIVDLDDGGRVTAMETLVRWRHPVRGMVSPVEFIGIAEETGLIGVLGEWVLNEACDQLVAWQHSLGPDAPVTMSVNLSRAQIVEPGVVEMVAGAIARSGLSANALQLEVTESMAAQDVAIQARLRALKSLGVVIALDDFGTGYSSLASLHGLPIDVLKIDRSFVSQSTTSAHHRVLIEAVCRIARSLGMQTVAEGIETHAESELMAQLDCDKAQGFWYARPLPAAEATAWLFSRAEAAIGPA